MGENLLPWNAVSRLQARGRIGRDEVQVLKIMSPLEQLDQALDNIIRELTLRILVPRMGEFDRVWEIANQVCDRYQIRQNL
jgi:hypothetical protein